MKTSNWPQWNRKDNPSGIEKKIHSTGQEYFMKKYNLGDGDFTLEEDV